MVMETGQFCETHYSEPTAYIHRHCKAPYPDFRVKHSSHPADDLNVPPFTEFLTAPFQPQSSYDSSSSSSIIDNTPTHVASAIPSQPHPLSACSFPSDLQVTDLSYISSGRDSNAGELAAAAELTNRVQESMKTMALEEESHKGEAKRHSRLGEHRKNSTATPSQVEERARNHDCITDTEMRQAGDQDRLARLTQLARSLDEKVTALEHVMNEKLDRVTSELEGMKKQHHQLLARTTNCSCSVANDNELKEKLERVTSELEKMSKQHHQQEPTRTISMLVIVLVVVYSRPIVYVIDGPSDVNPS